MTADFVLRAGPAARRLIEHHGLTPDLITLLAAPAGGPKFIAVQALDAWLFSTWLPQRRQPLPAIGSSIGAFRIIAGAHRDPAAALARLTRAYFDKTYPRRPTPLELTAAIRDIFRQLHDPADDDHILQHPWLRPHIVTTLCQGLSGARHPLSQGLGMGLAYLDNLRHRDAMARRFHRCLFHAGDTPCALQHDAFPTRHVRLTRDNLEEATLASGTLPLAMETRRDLPGAPRGAHVDGGMIDYHMDLVTQGETPPLTFIPHYEQRVVPGWFDKRLPRRHPRHGDHLLVLSPSPALVADLPGGKIPCRQDFKRYAGNDAGRLQAWQAALRASERLRDGFREALDRGRIMDVLQPLHPG